MLHRPRIVEKEHNEQERINKYRRILKMRCRPVCSGYLLKNQWLPLIMVYPLCAGGLVKVGQAMGYNMKVLLPNPHGLRRREERLVSTHPINRVTVQDVMSSRFIANAALEDSHRK
ncbi:hypothetical protein Tco_1219597 [Tanacetum coccineum]